ncbi:MAG: hypothetical protein REI96_10065, partial [Flavobacterium nitrogenifigens]|nr:hypothetical protein [Flavobacterium nitrogenifigens]
CKVKNNHQSLINLTNIGDSVSGNINVSGKYGAGILTTDTISEIEINTEWISYGKLKAFDKKGNEYQLIVK